MIWINNGCSNVYDAVQKKTGNAEKILNPRREYCVTNMRELAFLLKKYAKADILVTIIGDYDCDGVCASAELFMLLKKIGFSNVRIRLPKRMSEGYGLSESIVDEIQQGLIITVDNGIAAVSAIEKAKKKGLVVFIMDHHQPIIEKGQIVLPEADLIIDPHVEEVLSEMGEGTKPDFNGYCGAGLVYKLAQLMIPNTRIFKEIAAFAAIATIADLVPLVEDNRIIYHEGIMSIKNRTITPGLQSLIDILQSENYVTEHDIGFKIAPMLNAPGRLYDNGAMLSLATLLASSPENAFKMALQLKDINDQRKALKDSATKRAEKIIEENNLSNTNPIVIYDPETPEGIVGLVAGTICETYNASAIVFTKTGNKLKGSARAIENDNIKNALDQFHDKHPEILLKYGGHKHAAGLTVAFSGLDLFKREMEKILSPVRKKDPELSYDLTIAPSDIPLIAADLERFRPFGEGNPQINVRINHFMPIPRGNSFYMKIGKDSIRFWGVGCEVVGFSMADRFLYDAYPKQLDIIGKISYKNFRGSKTVQVEILDYIAREKLGSPQFSINSSIASALQQVNLF